MASRRKFRWRSDKFVFEMDTEYSIVNRKQMQTWSWQVRDATGQVRLRRALSRLSVVKVGTNHYDTAVNENFSRHQLDGALSRQCGFPVPGEAPCAICLSLKAAEANWVDKS